MIKNFIGLSLFLGMIFSQAQIHPDRELSWKEKYNAAPEKESELIHTKLKLRFDYAKKHVIGEEWVTVRPYFYDQNTLVLDAKAMDIHQVSLNGKPLQFDYDGLKLNIKLNKVYTKDQSYTVYINYTAKPEEVKQQGSAAINDAKGLYFINPDGSEKDKPTQIWTQGETEASSCWFPTIDAPNQKTTQEIELIVPNQYVTLSNGLLQSQTQNSDGTRTDYWKMDMPHAPYLFFVGVGDYEIIKDTWKGKPVNYYVEKEYADYAKEMYGVTPEMLTFFSDITGIEYPWPKYDQISARDYVSGAMENTTAVLHQHAVNQTDKELADENRWESVIAHEAFHHWFGDYVTCESWANLTVNESFANYSEYLWKEYKYGRDDADAHLDEDTKGYKAGSNEHKKLVRFGYEDKEDMFDAVTYNKGGAILHMLRDYIGFEAFKAGMNLYLKDNKFGTGEAHQLRLAFEEVSGKDLNWFFNQWYFGSGHPKLNINYGYNDQTHETVIVIEQTQKDLFEIPIKIGIYHNGNHQVEEVWLNEKKETFKFKTNGKPDLINVDDEKVLLIDRTENKTTENYVFQYNHVKNYKDRKEALEKTKDLISTNSDVLKMYKKALNDPYYGIRLIALFNLNMEDVKVKKEMLPIIEKMAKNDSKNLVRARAIEILSSLEDKSYLPLFQEGLKVNSAAISLASLSGMYEVDPSFAIEYVKKNPMEIKELDDFSFILAKIYIEGKDESQLENIAKFVNMYPFLQIKEDSDIFKEGYDWVVQSDNLKATQNLGDAFVDTAITFKKYDLAKRLIPMVEQAIQTKQTLHNQTKSDSLLEQIDYLQQTIEKLKGIK
ncbi:membrane alanyl aminopeptidase [Flavobacteriaceae bacterium UJ101]|nr:membrane alanyl aminopeptidase [Flavobacteriaceae bacterium UJ101]